MWLVLNPLLLCALYGFVFAVVLRLPPPSGYRGGYAEFILAGLLPWIGVQEALLRATGCITDQAHLVKKLVFPLELLVGSAVAAALVLQVVGIALLALFLGVTAPGTLRPLPLLGAFVFELLLLAGPALLLAALHVYFRDLSQLLGPAFTIAFYLTPIVYSEELVPAAFRSSLRLNPVATLVKLFRAGLLGLEAPGAGEVLAWSGLALVLALVSVRWFRRQGGAFSDLL